MPFIGTGDASDCPVGCPVGCPLSLGVTDRSLFGATALLPFAAIAGARCGTAATVTSGVVELLSELLPNPLDGCPKAELVLAPKPVFEPEPEVPVFPATGFPFASTAFLFVFT